MLTVLMATHNGAKTLPRVFDAYSRLQSPDGGWQLIVVDNASTDSTADILRARRADMPTLPLTPLRTEGRGKNLALNHGLTQAQGDLVVLTDDDAVPDAAWLRSLRDVADAQPAFDVFGGLIEPIWPEGLAEWIPRLVNLGATFAITPAGAVPGPVQAAQIWGPNMAVRRSVFDAGHRFDESVGPAAGQYMMGSEVEFTCRIERHGHRAWFTQDARVGHIIRPNQVERQWIVDRAYRLGRHMYHQEKLEPGFADGPMLRGAPRWKYGRYAAEQMKSLIGAVTRNADARFTADWELSFLRGYLAEAGRNLPAATAAVHGV